MSTWAEAGVRIHPGVTMTLLLAVLVVAAVSDWRTGKVRNALTYPAVLLGLAWAVSSGWMAGGVGGAMMELTAAVVAAGAALTGFALLFMLGGLGGGDVKLMAAVGAISGDWRVVLATTVYAFVVAAVMAVGVMVGRGIVRQTAQRLLVAAMLTASRSPEALGEPRVDAKVPFAVAIAVGGTVAGLELLLGVRTPWAGFAVG